MLRLAIFVLGLALVAAASLEANWQIYKHKYNKKYLGDEDPKRRLIWEANLWMIESHNERYAKGLTSYYLRENHFTDMTSEEVSARVSGFRMPTDFKPRFNQTRARQISVPDQIDWRDQGAVTPVKDQQNCKGCWAFSATGALEGQHFRATGQLVSLSESNLIDCSHNGGNQGCVGGGIMDAAFDYTISNHGIDTEEAYPFTPMDMPCKFNPDSIGATISSYKDVERGSEDALKQAVAEIGPISVAIDASDPTFKQYGGGVYDNPGCSTTNLDHAVLVVGYGTQDGKDIWIIKNSWNTVWGIEGYGLMSRNKNNQCGIASVASYPVV